MGTRRTNNESVDRTYSRREALAAGGTTALLSLAGCSGVLGSGTDTVTFGTLPLATSAPVLIAEKKGYFEDRNIEVKRKRIGGVPLATPKLASGDIDVAAGSIGASVFNSIAQDVPIKVVADYSKHFAGAPSADRVWARNEIFSAGDGFADLVDAVDGRLTVAHNAVGGSLDYVLGRVLDVSGVAWEDVKVKELQFSDMVPAMMSKEIDVAIAPDPLGLALQGKAKAKHVVYGSAVLPHLQIGAHFFGGPFIEERSDVAVRWLEGLILGIRKYYEMGSYPDDRVASLVHDAFGIDTTAIRSSIPALPNKNGAVNVESLLRQQDYHYCRGYVEQRVDRDAIVETDLRSKALDSVGTLDDSAARATPELMHKWSETAPRPYHPIGQIHTVDSFPTDRICQ